MKMADRIRTLVAENTALREKLSARRAVDAEPRQELHEAVGAVARNIVWLKAEERERVLLAVAVLYGIVKPTAPLPISGAK